jgi:hypothetical protein
MAHRRFVRPMDRVEFEDVNESRRSRVRGIEGLND